ncbi:MAG: carboxypeptidase regulatory-like domain-containing protein [Candidatus Aminicenantes bacterium]|nr:MAG: carboxypeptidase regulatory-like domain-containing protein [Candidatus Aminicenantes bacterium]
MRLRSIFMLPHLVMALIFVSQTIFPAGEDSNKEDYSKIVVHTIDSQDKSDPEENKYGSISGRITYHNSGIGIPDVIVEISGYTIISGSIHIKIKTDWKGRFSCNMLEPGEYTIRFSPKHPFCFENEWKRISVEIGKNTVINKKLELGGAISGKIFCKDKEIKPFKGVKVIISSGSFRKVRVTKDDIEVKNYRSKSTGEADDTKADGSYFVGRLCPFGNYFIRADCHIPGQADRILTGITVKKGEETKVDDIVFDLNDITGVEGFVVSSLDGKTIADAIITFWNVDKLPITGDSVRLGETKTNSHGYFHMKNLEAGKYSITALPPAPPKRDKMTGKPYYTMAEYPGLLKKMGVVVKKGYMQRVYIKLDIPSHSK